MSRRSRKTEHRRREAHRLRAEGLSIREIARRLGVSASTAHAYIAEPPPEKRQAPPNAAGPGNERARTHGAFSERDLRPLRQRAAEGLREAYPWLPEQRVQMIAQRIALHTSSTNVLESLAHPHRVRGRDVDWQSLAQRADKLGASLEKTFRDLDLEAAQHRGSQPSTGSLFGDVPLARLTDAELEELEEINADWNQERAQGLLARVHERIAAGVDEAPEWPYGSGAWVKDDEQGYRREPKEPPEPVPSDRRLPPGPADPFNGAL